MGLQFEKVIPSIPYILQGIGVTLQFTAISALCGFILGTILSLIKISKVRILYWFAVAYTSVFRGTPLILQLSLIYFATPQLTDYQITALEAGVLAFGLNSAAYISEIIRAGIMAIDKGQQEAALALGIPYNQMMKDIILPQAFKNILPALVNEGISLIKESALVSTIGALDLLRRGMIVSADKFLYFEPLLIVGAIYYILVMILTLFARYLERRLRLSD